MNSRETRASIEHSYLSGRDVRPFEGFDSEEYEALGMFGIGMDEKHIDSMMHAMDAVQPTITTGSIATPAQFLQNWLPGFVAVVTAARKIDVLTGVMITGAWEDEEIVQGIIERTGKALPYGDYTNVHYGSWNVNFDRRSVVRFEDGLMVGRLDEARAGRMNVSDAEWKRKAAAQSLEIIRNSVGFNGYNSGANRTYGFLNDPGLPAYVNVAAGASTSTLWSTKTFLEICKDIRGAIVALRTASQDLIDPKSTPMTLAVSTNAVDWMSTSSDFGISVTNWLKEAYPNIRVVSAPELNSANGGANVFYLYADSLADVSTDDGRVFIQPIASKFQMLGVEQKAKGYLEAYTNAMAGVMCKRPWAVVRRSGI